MKKLLFIIFIVAITFTLTAADNVKTDKTKKSCCSQMDKGKCSKMKKEKMMKMHKGMHGKHMKMHTKSFSGYISAQGALATDDLAKAKEAFGEIVKSSEGDVKKIAEKALKSGDLKCMRAQFKELSKLMATSSHPKGFGTAYCPMAKAWWVQKEGKIMNPYFGKKMQSCGSFKEYKKGSGHKMHHKM